MQLRHSRIAPLTIHAFAVIVLCSLGKNISMVFLHFSEESRHGIGVVVNLDKGPLKQILRNLVEQVSIRNGARRE